MTTLKKALNSVFRCAGYEFGRIKLPLDYTRDDSICPRQLYCEGRENFLVNVPIQKLKDSRLIRAWVTALSHYATCGRSGVRDELQKYFENFQPRNVAEVLKISARLPWHRNHPLEWVMPWQKSAPDQARRSRESTMLGECKEHGFLNYTSDSGWKGFGPIDDALLDVETNRLVQTYESLSREGFQSRHGYTTARLFLSGKDHLVLADAGWHRIAAMFALGYTELPMKFGAAVRNIRREDCVYWPGVRAGLFSEAEAVEIFDQRFRPYKQVQG